MNNAQVAHVWAQQRKPEAEGSNFYFNGSTIYSFGGHFPIAAFADAQVDGRQVVLFTIENGWGGYTGRHIQFARNALSGLPVCVIECLEPAERNGSHNSPRLNLDARHAANLADYLARYENALTLAGKARTRGPEHIAYAEQMRTLCALYCEAFGLIRPTWTDEAIPADIETIRAQSAERAARAIESKRRALAPKIAEWRAGGSCDISGYPVTLLRLSRNGLNVETSRAASVPLESARQLWRIVARCAASGSGYMVPPDRAVSVGDFELREIRADGTCIVGCHELTFTETRAFAIAQGWNV